MAKEFAKAFYHSKTWKNCRKSYIDCMPAYKRGLCESCYANGIYTPGVELHHKIWLTPDNINDPKVSLNHDNLIFLCKDCHAKIHASLHETKDKRYFFDENGNILKKIF